MNNASSIGIIGGADGPTAIFVSHLPLTTILLWGGIAAVVFIGLIMLFLRGKK